MKNILLLFAIFALNNTLAQSWKYLTKTDELGVEYQSAYSNGSGSEYPYHNPKLSVDIKDNDSLTFHLTEIGYFQNTKNLSITWMFNKNPEEQYKTLDFELSEDGETIYLHVFEHEKSKDIVNMLDFIEKLKTGNRIDVKIEEKYGKNDLIFSLSGSTKALSSVISEDYKTRMASHFSTMAQHKVEAFQNKEADAIKKEAVKLRIAELLDKYDLNPKQKKIVMAMISYNAALKHFKIVDIDNLTLEPVENDVHVLLFNKNSELIGTIKKMGKTVPELLEVTPTL